MKDGRLKMCFRVFAGFIVAVIIHTGCSSELSLRITHDPAEFIPYREYPDALVVKAGKNFSLKCEGETHVNWTYPEYYSDEPDADSLVNISGWMHNDQAIMYKWAANLNVIRSTYKDTGNYHCKNDEGTRIASQYVYVRDEHKLFTDPEFNYVPTQYKSLVIPCRPTSPDVKMTLSNQEETLVPDSGEVYHGMQVSYDPMVGFTLSNLNIINGGMYQCQGDRSEDNHTESDYTSVRVLAHTDNVPKPLINGSDFHLRLVAGTALVLNCTVTTNSDVQFVMSWKFPNDHELGSARIIDHNTTSWQVSDNNGGLKKIGCKMLTIKNLILSDMGTYECIVRDHNMKSSSSKKNVNVTGADEKFLQLKVQGDSTINVTSGTPLVQWVVTMSAHPKPTLDWYAPGDKRITSKESGWKYHINTTEHGTILRIKDVSIADAGEYKLRARGEVQKTLRLVLAVRVAPSVSLNIAPEELFYTVGKTYNMTCEVTAYPAPVVKWFFKRCDNPPDCSSNYAQIKQSEISEKMVGESMTVFTYLRMGEFSGYVTCQAANSEGNAEQTKTFWVSDVHDGFDAIGPDVIVEGDPVSLSCGASKYNYTNNIAWYYKPQPVSRPILLMSKGSGYVVEDQSTAYSYKKHLYFSSISKSQSGSYTCKVFSNKIGEVNKSISIRVEDLATPSILPSTGLLDGELLVSTGDPAQLTCRLNGGRPEPIITWYKDGIPIQANTDYELEHNNQTLNIKFSKVALEGVYKCRAWNRAGEDSQSSTLRLKDKASSPNVAIIASIIVIATLLLILIAYLIFKIRKEQKLRKELKAIGLDQFDKGAMDSINPELPIDDQAELLPYDRKWEFPRDKLKMGKQLGAGAFGVVMKAEATGIDDTEEVTTVAVKMVKRNADYTYIKALASELKIMVHLGKHLNVVNLLGACTKNLNKRELYVIVEYCRFGNLHNYLLRHRSEFIDQVDPVTGVIDPTLGADIIARHESMANKSRIKYAALSFSRNRSDSATSSDYLGTAGISSSSGGAINSETVLISMTPTGGEEGCMVSNNSIQPEWRTNYSGDYKGTVRPICTRDLLCYAFQVARGMDYLAGRKVLHGDLAARNILLSDDNIVKICDFGLAKSMYKSDNYKKKGDGPLPVKWMAVESIRDRVFSTQSDVWSFGIVLWEFFSLARTPYPGMEADEKLYNKLVEGYRMDRPEYATKDVYRIMDKCWLARPSERPTFGDLSLQLGNMLEDSVRMHYVDLNDPYMEMNTSQWKESQQSDYLAMMTAPTYDNMVSPSGEGEGSGHQYANGYLVPRPTTSASEEETNAGYLCMKSPSEKESSIFSPRSDDGSIFNFAPMHRHVSDDLTKPDELKPMLSPSNVYKTPSGPSSPVNNLNKEAVSPRNNGTSSDNQTKPNFAPSFSNPSYQTMGAIPSSTPGLYANLPNQEPVRWVTPSHENFSSPDYLAMGNPVDSSSGQVRFTNTKDKEGSVNFSNHGHNLSDASSGFQSDSGENSYVN